MSNNVIFKVGTSEQYKAILTKNPNTLYWLYDVLQLYKGEELYGTGAEATELVAGLMSPEDKAKLNKLVNSGVANLSAANSAIVLTDVDGGKTIGLKLSAVEGNAAVIHDDGLFVPVAPTPLIPSYTLEKQEVATEGYSATYRLKRIYGEEVSYVGSEINIPKDLFIKYGSVAEVTEDDIPYIGARIGDLYIDIILSNPESSHIYIPANKLIDRFYAGKGLKLENNTFEIVIDANNANGLVVTESGLGLGLATAEAAGAMSAIDKVTLNKIASEYISKIEVKAITERVKYEITSKPYGTLVNYGENEIRVMCPADTQWVKQSVGSTGNANMYYMGFRAYAPDGAVGFKEGDQGVIEDEYFDFSGDFAGTDAYGRNYSIVWLALASYDEATGTWTYFGKNSSEEKYIGWTYVVEWYDANGKVIESDTIRINLSNENCHNNVKPYYMTQYVTTNELDEVKENITALEQNFVWEDM